MKIMIFTEFRAIDVEILENEEFIVHGHLVLIFTASGESAFVNE